MIDMNDRMAELGKQVRARRESFSMRQSDLAEEIARLLDEEEDEENGGKRTWWIGKLERAQFHSFFTPEEVRAIEVALRWPPHTILKICGYLDDQEMPERTQDSRDVIATLMDATDFTPADKRNLSNIVRSMSRRTDDSQSS